jgi:hypothetical protein
MNSPRAEREPYNRVEKEAVSDEPMLRSVEVHTVRDGDEKRSRLCTAHSVGSRYSVKTVPGNTRAACQPQVDETANIRTHSIPIDRYRDGSAL